MKRGPTQNMMTTLPNFRSHSGIPWRVGSFIYSSDQETQPHVSCHSEELKRLACTQARSNAEHIILITHLTFIVL